MDKSLEYVLILLFLCGLLACQGSESKPTLSYERMVDLRTDLFLAEEISRDYPVLLRDSMNIILLESLLKVYNLTENELNTNLYLYESDYEFQQNLLKDVKKRLDSISIKSKSKSSTK